MPMASKLSRCPEDFDISPSHRSPHHVYGEPYGPPRTKGLLRSSLKGTDSKQETSDTANGDPLQTLHNALSFFTCVPMPRECSFVTCPSHDESEDRPSIPRDVSHNPKPAMRGVGSQQRRVSFTRYQEILENQERCVQLRSLNLDPDQIEKLEDALLQAELETRRREKKETFDAGVRRLAQKTGLSEGEIRRSLTPV